MLNVTVITRYNLSRFFIIIIIIIIFFFISIWGSGEGCCSLGEDV